MSAGLWWTSGWWLVGLVLFGWRWVPEMVGSLWRSFVFFIIGADGDWSLDVGDLPGFVMICVDSVAWFRSGTWFALNDLEGINNGSCSSRLKHVLVVTSRKGSSVPTGFSGAFIHLVLISGKLLGSPISFCSSLARL